VFERRRRLMDDRPLCRRLAGKESPGAGDRRGRDIVKWKGMNGRMLDTHAVARSLTDAEFTPTQADAITNAVRLAAEHGNHVTSDQFKVGLAEVRTEIAEVRTEIGTLDTRLSTQIAEVRTEIANLETRLIRWMVGTVIATATLTVGILRLLG
jgi:hypothetical protein